MHARRRRLLLRSNNRATVAAASVSVSAPTLLTNGTQNVVGASSFATASVTPSATAVTVLTAFLRNTTAPAISGGRATWSLKKQQSGTSGPTLYVWVGTGAVTPGTITVTASTGTWDTAIWEVKDCEGGNQTTPVVAANTVSVQHVSTNTVCTITVAQALGAGNLFLSAFGFGAGGGTGTPRTGWTEVSDQQITSNSWMETQYRLSTDTAADVTLPGTGYAGGGILIEIAHA